MSKHAELVKQLRQLVIIDEVGSNNSLGKEAAGAIEEQENHISELERVNKNLREKINQHHDRYWEARWRTEKAENEKLFARIAELEAAIDGLSKAFIEEMVGAGWIMRDIEKIPAFHAARAALGENDE